MCLYNMTPDQFKIAVQILCLLFGPWLTYSGFRMVFNKRYYMRVKEGYLGEDIDTEYAKLSTFHRQYRRYKWGLQALGGGVILLILLIWTTFFAD